MTQQTETPYDKTFFDNHLQSSLASARAVMPIVLDLVPVHSVVDFGCGCGTWLKACEENGVEIILGLDGDYVDRRSLLIEPCSFRASNLQKPIGLEQRFDLALCLEVAEHLPENEARTLVKSLTDAAPIILFSAALPGQGGTNHVNEQWPCYWERLFAEQGMRKYDVLRPLIWSDKSIEYTYRQNIYLFTKKNLENLEKMACFEPEMCLISSRLMGDTTFNWSSRALKYMPLLRRIHSFLSRFT